MSINYTAPIEIRDFRNGDWFWVIEIRDFRNGDWFWVSKYVWLDRRLTKSDKLIYGTLAYFANQRQVAWPSITKLASFSNVSKRQTYKSIKKLELLNYIKVKRHRTRGKPNEYKLLKVKGELTAPIKKGCKNDTKKGAKTTLKRVQNRPSNNNNEQERIGFTPSASGIKILLKKMRVLGLK